MFWGRVKLGPDCGIDLGERNTSFFGMGITAYIAGTFFTRWCMITDGLQTIHNITLEGHLLLPKSLTVRGEASPHHSIPVAPVLG
jgi:hypothetical protein